MSLVTLIQSADKTLRSAVVQVEDFFLPKEAKFTGEVDEAGRKVYTLLDTEVKKVEPVVANTAKADVVLTESEFEKLEDEAKAEFVKLEGKVKGWIKKVETKL